MDSLQGIPVEYKLDAFNLPRTGTTLCYPKIARKQLNVNTHTLHHAEDLIGTEQNYVVKRMSIQKNLYNARLILVCKEDNN